MRLARLWRVRPADVAAWSGPEILAALQEIGDARPIEDWLPQALAELVALQGGGDPEEIRRRWVFEGAAVAVDDDAELVAWAESQARKQANG